MAKVEEDEEGNPKEPDADANTELIEEIRGKIEELRDAAQQAIIDARPEDAEEEEIDRESLSIRFPDDLLYKLLRLRLNENSCRNRGYILDGYPKKYEDAVQLFMGLPPTEEDQEPDENQQKIVIQKLTEVESQQN